MDGILQFGLCSKIFIVFFLNPFHRGLNPDLNWSSVLLGGACEFLSANLITTTTLGTLLVSHHYQVRFFLKMSSGMFRHLVFLLLYNL